MPFGAHMSIAGGIARAFGRGEQVGCETMQIFTKNERQWKPKAYTAEEIETYVQEQQRTQIQPVVVHDSYLINLATADPDLWEKSLAAFAGELERCALLGVPYVVSHPGAHTGSGEDAGIKRQAEALNRLFDEGVGNSVMVLLETTAGQGTVLGWRFEHLAQIRERVQHAERIGICLDTCHIFAAGYDIRTAEAYTQTFADFDRTIGLEHLKVFHLNDTQHQLGSRRDRHQHIGQGHLGIEAFRLLVNDPRFREHPMIIETPKGKKMTEDTENLTLLRSLREEA
ncbi:MAG: deoxyribonuclease IV [Chloroflexaceae bacterium]|nr:deoxyribonuclease IV [Chloroflexaceae bacterium]